MKKYYVQIIGVMMVFGSMSRAESSKPNFLFIAIDDLNTFVGANRELDNKNTKYIRYQNGD